MNIFATYPDPDHSARILDGRRQEAARIEAIKQIEAEMFDT